MSDRGFNICMSVHLDISKEYSKEEEEDEEEPAVTLMVVIADSHSKCMHFIQVLQPSTSPTPKPQDYLLDLGHCVVFLLQCVILR